MILPDKLQTLPQAASRRCALFFLTALYQYSVWAASPTVMDKDDEIQAPSGQSMLDIRTPGSDLANFPNSAYTLPKGGFYVESSPYSLQGTSSNNAWQFNTEYLLRYGLLDDIELRLYSQGYSLQGNPSPSSGFSPLTFDTKIHFWDELSEYHLPAMGLEIALQTNLLGSSAFDSGMEPNVNLNFDQTLPWDLAIEYNVGASRFQSPDDISEKVWDVTFQWAVQRDIVEDVAVFINGYHNGANLPRIAKGADKTSCGPAKDVTPGCIAGLAGNSYTQHVIGAGGIWTANDNWAFYTNLAAGLTANSPEYVTYMGFAWTPP